MDLGWNGKSDENGKSHKKMENPISGKIENKWVWAHIKMENPIKKSDFP